MNEELEAMIKKALSEEETTDKLKDKEKIPKITSEELEELYEKDSKRWWDN